MPKLQRTPEQIKAAYLSGVIQKYMTVQDITPEQLAKKIGVGRTTMYTRIREPEGFSYSELFRTFKVLKVPPEEILECYEVTGERRAV